VVVEERRMCGEQLGRLISTAELAERPRQGGRTLLALTGSPIPTARLIATRP
jgi:uncharacterized SAM-binding protein YcdF (DUF218 family)